MIKITTKVRDNFVFGLAMMFCLLVAAWVHFKWENQTTSSESKTRAVKVQDSKARRDQTRKKNRSRKLTEKSADKLLVAEASEDEDELPPLDVEGFKKLIAFAPRSEAVMDELEERLDDISCEEDSAAMKRVVEALSSFKDWKTALPKNVQDKILDTLTDFLPAFWVEVMEFLDSADQEIAKSALDSLVEAVEGSDSDDSEASWIIAELSKRTSDSDAAESLVDHIEFMDAKPAAVAMISIIRSGNDIFRQVLAEHIENITDQTSMTEDAVLRWASVKAAEEKEDREE